MNRLKEAMYYETLEDERVKCHLCPHGCIIAEGGVGFCKVRVNRDGILYTMNYGEITSYAYDPIEKKPLYHFYPGNKIFSLGSFGCNLTCKYCQNWEIAHDKPLTVQFSDEDIIRLSGANGSIGIAFTYNEPSVGYEYILNLSKKIKKHNLKNVLVTNGYIEKEPFEELLPYIDATNIDLKFIDNKLYSKMCGGSLLPVLETIELASTATHVEVTSLIIEGENDSKESIEKMAKWLSNIDENIPLHINRYHPAYKLSLPATSIETLQRAKEVASKYLNYVYVGNVWGIDINTYCPQCKNIIIDRNYDRSTPGITDGKCNSCGYDIKIIN